MFVFVSFCLISLPLKKPHFSQLGWSLNQQLPEPCLDILPVHEAKFVAISKSWPFCIAVFQQITRRAFQELGQEEYSKLHQWLSAYLLSFPFLLSPHFSSLSLLSPQHSLLSHKRRELGWSSVLLKCKASTWGICQNTNSQTTSSEIQTQNSWSSPGSLSF